MVLYDDNIINICKFTENDISCSDSSDQFEMPSKKFVFTFLVDEWKIIQPHEIKYKIIDKTRPMQNSRFLKCFIFFI